ncbi:agmatine deiminase family protein [Caminibacter mediatlanticus TB-2]|uniref:Agmatine deiminase family protein n=1 Tax=Caminibacter mediatlanticus TB-2 TaxID=391592 RepID=A0ABX5V654_9BACT|nr:agmatine deiminase family protein [Caminibacter mediatlanticus]QCT93755.1 agmatine deiminase family protein [Caminibacter mediatlanticus TB-2]
MNYLIPEWEKQEFIQLVFPHKNTDWACYLNEAIDTFTKIAYAIAEHEKVLICYEDKNTISHLKHKNFLFKKVKTNDTWARDFGAISVKIDNEVKLLDFKFNGWGLKYPANYDNTISRKIFNIYKSYNFVLEGGSIDTNGKTLLTTSKCLLEENRNYPMSKKEIEEFLKRELFVKDIIWLNHGFLEGDDTDSHIDTLARFVNKDTIVYCKCFDKNDIHYNELQKMEKELKKTKFNQIPLPLPTPKIFDNERLPATYVNFLIINNAVIVPTYNDKYDEIALNTFREIFKDREIIGIDASILIRQHGSIHCITKEYFTNIN